MIKASSTNDSKKCLYLRTTWIVYVNGLREGTDLMHGYLAP
jgi:hypothetical protein